MSLLSRLLGRGKEPAAEPEVYKDYRIFSEPMQESGGYRIAARIEKEISGELKCHQMIRADTCSSFEEASSLSLGKAKALIDEQGDALFG
ncbi:MAG: HlyU family transcriptional regulator [Rhodobacter sp.]|nr:HlyU family transcriptional regulator [Rhodobacter sp.]